jgi:probable phosphoglycerate mutase
MTRLLLIRHCQTINNVKYVLSSAEPGPDLTKEGWRQAEALARSVTASQALYTSPLLRALRTANVLGSHIGLAPIIHHGLRECGVGELEGRGDTAAYDRYHQAWDQCLTGLGLNMSLGPGGETGDDCLNRVLSAFAQIHSRHLDDTVALVSHGALLHFAVTLLATNIDSSWTRSREFPNAGIVTLDFDTMGIICTDWCGVTPLASN